MHTRINKIIEIAGISKTDFAKRLNLSQGMVSRLCSGSAKPSDRTIADICREFGCDDQWLRTGDGQPFRQESRQDMIMRFAGQTVRGSDEFRKAFVAGLAKLEPEDWQNLARIFKKFNDAYEKE